MADEFANDEALALTIEAAGDVQVVHVSGRLDTATTDRFDARMQQIVAPDAARLVLSAVHPRVVDILEIAGFTPLFVLAATSDEALAQLQTTR